MFFLADKGKPLQHQKIYLQYNLARGKENKTVSSERFCNLKPLKRANIIL